MGSQTWKHDWTKSTIWSFLDDWPSWQHPAHYFSVFLQIFLLVFTRTISQSVVSVIIALPRTASTALWTPVIHWTMATLDSMAMLATLTGYTGIFTTLTVSRDIDNFDWIYRDIYNFEWISRDIDNLDWISRDIDNFDCIHGYLQLWLYPGIFTTLTGYTRIFTTLTLSRDIDNFDWIYRDIYNFDCIQGYWKLWLDIQGYYPGINLHRGMEGTWQVSLEAVPTLSQTASWPISTNTAQLQKATQAVARPILSSFFNGLSVHRMLRVLLLLLLLLLLLCLVFTSSQSQVSGCVNFCLALRVV